MRSGIYMEYSIWGEEDKDFVTALFQFYRGKSLSSIVLPPPATVELDGEVLRADSARETGGYYELQKPLAEFAGKHNVVFTDETQKRYKEDFSFVPFRLATEINGKMKRPQLVLQILGVKENDLLRVVLTDTALYGEGVNEIDTIKNGSLDLRKFLKNIKNGPITLQLYKEEERWLENTPGGGKISITYSLKREFELKD